MVQNLKKERVDGKGDKMCADPVASYGHPQTFVDGRKAAH